MTSLARSQRLVRRTAGRGIGYAVALLAPLLATAGAASLLSGCAGADDGSAAPADGDGEGDTAITEDALGYSANLVGNGFFENPIYAWNDLNPAHGITNGHWHWGVWTNTGPMGYQLSSSAGTVTRTTAAAWGGTYGVRSSAKGADTEIAIGTYSTSSIVPGAQYRVWLVARRRSGVGQCVVLSFVSNLYGRLDDMEFPAGTSTYWHVFAKTVTAPKYANTVYLGLQNCKGSHEPTTYDWDSPALRKVL